MVFVAAVLGQLAPLADELIDIGRQPGWKWAETTSDSARGVLGLLAGTLMSFTGVVFSITMLTLSQTSSQYGSRLLRTFLNHNLTQFTLGMFTGTSLYCILVLRTVRGGSSTVFTPHLSTALGVGLAIFSLAVFIGFIHHVATTLQAQTVITSVAEELIESIDRLYPDSPAEQAPARDGAGGEEDRQTAGENVSLPLHGFAVVRTVCSREAGYLQALDHEALRYLAESSGTVLRVLPRPGEFLGTGQPILEVLAPAGPSSYQGDKDFDHDAAAAFLTGSRRTPRQDICCGVLELVEMAVRALSPGINDPFTAQSCIDYLSDTLCRLAVRPERAVACRTQSGNLCLITNEPAFADVLETAFRPIRFHAGDSLLVTLALLDGLQRIAWQVSGVAAARAVLEQAAAVLETARDSFALSQDVQTAETLHEQVTSLVLERFPAITEESLLPQAEATV